MDKILEWLMANPVILSIISVLVSPLLAKIPGILPILNFVAAIAGFKLVPLNPTPTPTPSPLLVPMFGADGKVIIDPATNQPVMTTAPQQQYGGLLDNLNLEKLMPLLLIGGMVFFMMSQGGGCKPKPAPTPPASKADASATPTPAADLQGLVGPIKALAAAKPDAALKLAGYYSAGADVIRRDSQLIATTGAVRSAKINADALYLQRSPEVGSLPGIGAAVDTVLTQSVGLEDKPLDTVTRARLADTFAAIAWAMGG